jgi:quercetin dioxygenase-like cupin family protein
MGNQDVASRVSNDWQATERQTVQKLSLDTLARENLEKAVTAPSGRSAATVYGGREQMLRQTLLALTANTWLSEHENPGEATLLVLRGKVRLHAGPNTLVGMVGDLLAIPAARHSLEALENCVVLLTAITK